MGFYNREIFVSLLLACCLTTSASPARRAFDTLPADINNLNGQVQSLENVDTTIKEVENLLQADPSLPRLTRGEILDIIENLTRTDVQKVFSNHRDQKAIMVVMPYSADSAQNGDVQSLYTKPPITQMIGEVGDADEVRPEIKKKRPTKKPYQPIEQNYLDYTSKVAKLPSTTERFYTEEQFQQQQSTVDVITQKASRTTTENPITRFINRRRKTTKIPPNHKQEFQDITTSTTTTTTTTTTPVPRTTRKRKATRRPTPPSTTTLETLVYVPESGINIVDPPTFHKLPETVVAFQPIPTRPSRTTTTTTVKTTTTTATAAPIVVDEVQIPEDFKEVLKSLDILIKQSPTEPAPVTNSPSFDQLSMTDQEKLKLLFASLGAAQTTTTTSTTTPEPDVVQVANNLTPEMRELLMTFGLIPDPNKDKTTTPKVETFMEPSSVVNADSYSSFKPLPVATHTNPNEEMEDILAKFGLVDRNNKNNREQKAISMSKPTNQVFVTPNLDVIPDKFKDVMADIGFENAKIPLPSSESQIETEAEIEAETEAEVKPKKPDHVFNPSVSGTEYATQDEINRLNQLMSVIKQFETLNGTASEDDLKHIDLEGLKDLVNSFNVPLDEQKGPNPIDYDIGLIKNEVKRQTSTTEKPTANSIINPSLALLEDSFGGPSDTVAETVTTSTTEAPKKTGFYYLVDWNSFLDIDNQKGKRVNLRFQPTIGDPKRFFSVNVP